MAYPLNDPEFKKLTRDYLWINPSAVENRDNTEKELLCRQWLHFLQPISQNNPNGFNLDVLVEMVEKGPLRYAPEWGKQNDKFSAINHLMELGFADRVVQNLSYNYVGATLLGGFMYCRQFDQIESLKEAYSTRVRQIGEKQNG